MHRALRPGGDVLALEALLSVGAQVDAVDEHGRTALYTAANAGYDEAVAWLISHGADPMRAADDGRSALHAAASCGHVETLNILFGAIDSASAIRAMQAVDAQGRSVADVAAAARHMNVVRALLDVHARCLADRERKPPPTKPVVKEVRQSSPEAEKVARLRGYAPILKESPTPALRLDVEAVEFSPERVPTP